MEYKNELQQDPFRATPDYLTPVKKLAMKDVIIRHGFELEKMGLNRTDALCWIIMTQWRELDSWRTKHEMELLYSIEKPIN
jgi:hypothetical protein